MNKLKHEILVKVVEAHQHYFPEIDINIIDACSIDIIDKITDITKQTAIEFSRWCSENSYSQLNGEWWFNNQYVEFHSNDEIFNKFLADKI